MTLQSLIHREGWRSQTLMFLASAQVLCSNCLSRRFPLTAAATTAAARRARNAVDLAPPRAAIKTARYSRPNPSSTFRIPNIASSTHHRRTLFVQSGMTQQHPLPPPEPLQELRYQLYKRSNPTATTAARPGKRGKQPSQRVRHVVSRRERREHIAKLYTIIQNDPALVEQLTASDVQAMMALLIPRTDDFVPSAAYWIMDDLVSRRSELFSNVELEALVALYVDNGQLDKAEQTVQQLMDTGHASLEKAMSALVAGLAREGRMAHAEGWLKEMQVRGYTTTSPQVRRAMVEGWLKLNDLVKAEEMSRQYWDMDLAAGLDWCGKQCVNEWRLAEARRFLGYKMLYGMPTTSLAARIVTKGLYTFRIKAVNDVLLDTCKFSDWAAAQVVAKKLLDYYIQRNNIKHAVWVWETTRELPGVLSDKQYATLLSALATANYHEHLMKLYRHVQPQYPGVLSVEVYEDCLRSLVTAKAYDHALEVFSDMKLQIPPAAMTKQTFYAMYSLCAQTGRVSLFRELLLMAGQIDMELDYKTMNAVMACYLVADDVKSAMQVFETISAAHGPDCIDYNLLMRATAINDGDSVDLTKLLKVLQHMNKLNIEPDRTTFRTLLTIYPGGDIEHQLFSQLLHDQHATRMDEIFLNNMALSRHIERHGAEKAATILMQNDRSALFPVVPSGTPIYTNGLTYKLIMDALLKSPRGAHVADRLYRNIKSRGWLPYQSVYEAMILCWARKGRLQRARRVMQDMEKDLDIKPGTKIYTMLVNGLLAHDRTGPIPALVSEIQERGLQLDDKLVALLEKHGFNSLTAKHQNKVS